MIAILLCVFFGEEDGNAHGTNLQFVIPIRRVEFFVSILLQGSISSHFGSAVNILLPANGWITGPRRLFVTSQLNFVFSQLYFALGRQVTV